MPQQKYRFHLFLFLEMRDIYCPVLQTGILFQGVATEMKAAGI